jgi:hypothetical protein
VAPLLMDLLTVLRGHRALVVGLGVAWRGLYEYAAYLQALNNLRVLIGQWLLEGGSHSEMLGLSADDFELVAWRTLGEGMLLIDMYEQLAARADARGIGRGRAGRAPRGAGHGLVEKAAAVTAGHTGLEPRAKPVLHFGLCISQPAFTFLATFGSPTPRRLRVLSVPASNSATESPKKTAGPPAVFLCPSLFHFKTN